MEVEGNITQANSGIALSRLSKGKQTVRKKLKKTFNVSWHSSNQALKAVYEDCWAISLTRFVCNTCAVYRHDENEK